MTGKTIKKKINKHFKKNKKGGENLMQIPKIFEQADVLLTFIRKNKEMEIDISYEGDYDDVAWFLAEYHGYTTDPSRREFVITISDYLFRKNETCGLSYTRNAHSCVGGELP